MKIEQRIRKIEDKLNASTSFSRFFMVLQSEPKSNVYNVKEYYKGEEKQYTIDDIDQFYKEHDSRDNFILKCDVVDNSHLEKVMYEEGYNDWYSDSIKARISKTI